MAISTEREAQIEAVIATFEGENLRWTNRMVHQEVGGSYRNLNMYLRDRRAAERASQAPVMPLVEELPPPVAPPPLPAPAQPPARGQLAVFQREFVAVRAQAEGTAPQSTEAMALRMLHAQFAAARSAAQEALTRARRLRPLVELTRANARNLAAGRPDALEYIGRVTSGADAQSALYRSALAVLTSWVGAEEAQRLVTSSDSPSWALV